MNYNFLKIIFIIVAVFVVGCNSGTTSSTNTTPAITMGASNGDVVDGATNISLTPNLALSFNVPIDPLTVNQNTVFLSTSQTNSASSEKLNDGGNILITNITTNSNNTVFKFNPASSLSINTTYYVTITNKVMTTTGVPISGQFSFTTGILQWSRQNGSANSYTEGYSISTDSAGNSYITGTTTANLFGQTESIRQDYFIAKYESTGDLKWARQVGTPNGNTSGAGISSDSVGNIYITGFTMVGISGQTQQGKEDYFVAKYDSNGNLKWTKQVGAATGNTEGHSISADSTGNIYIIGSTDVGISGQTQQGKEDYFVAKYDSSGDLKWTKQLGAPGGEVFGLQIKADNTGNIYITGFTDIGISGQTQQGLRDYFIAKYDSTGNLKWTRQVGAANGAANGYTQGSAISTDNSGNIYITGFTTVGISGQTQQGNTDYFIAKYNSDGILVWTRQVGSAKADTDGTYGDGISTDSDGNSYILGYTDSGIPGQNLQGISDYFIAKYDNNGNLKWNQEVGSANGNSIGCGIGIDSFGNTYITGYTDVGLSTQTQNGIQDYFIAKYSAY